MKDSFVQINQAHITAELSVELRIVSDYPNPLSSSHRNENVYDANINGETAVVVIQSDLCDVFGTWLIIARILKCTIFTTFDK